MQVLLLLLLAFDVASVKRSAEQRGVDYRGRVVVGPGRVSGRNVTLQDMIATAYGVQLSQVVSGGRVRWVESDEFELDARAAVPAGELRWMLQGLLAERFRLLVAREKRELRVQALVVDKGGLKPASAQGSFHFHGTMQQFADLLAVQGTIPATVEAGRPTVASAAPMHVIDATGLEGVYDIAVELKPEMGTDRFTEWQRVLKEQVGLRLEGRKMAVEVLVVSGAERVPVGN